jgi:hypothetical protein
MLFHMSIAAENPRHVAGVLAELWQGEARPFPPVSDDGWVALAGDERGTLIEVYPHGTVLREGDGDVDAYGDPSGTDRFSASHGAIATPLDRDAVLALAEREGWPAKYRKRGGMFGVVELWIEGRQMMEVLTPEMQAEYLAAMGRPNA